MRDIVMSFIYPRLIMYGNGDDSPAPKKKKHKGKGRPSKKNDTEDDDVLSKMPPAYPTTDVNFSIINYISTCTKLFSNDATTYKPDLIYRDNGPHKVQIIYGKIYTYII